MPGYLPQTNEQVTGCARSFRHPQGSRRQTRAVDGDRDRIDQWHRLRVTEQPTISTSHRHHPYACAEKPVTSRDLHVLVYDAAESVPTQRSNGRL